MMPQLTVLTDYFTHKMHKTPQSKTLHDHVAPHTTLPIQRTHAYNLHPSRPTSENRLQYSDYTDYNSDYNSDYTDYNSDYTDYNSDYTRLHSTTTATTTATALNTTATTLDYTTNYTTTHYYTPPTPCVWPHTALCAAIGPGARLLPLTCPLPLTALPPPPVRLLLLRG
eukprot:9503836-Pyramimonas_sp.AAC.1